MTITKEAPATGMVRAEDWTVVTTLDEATLARLRAEAHYLATQPFVDPTMLQRIDQAAGWLHPEWLASLSLPVKRHADYEQQIMVMLASAADAEHLAERDRLRRSIRDWHARRQAEEARKARIAKMEAWQQHKAAIPVTVEVWHNWYARAHTTGNNWSSDHIVVRAALDAGRLHRETGMALCQTRPDDPRFRYVFPHPDDDARVPTCKQCLRIADRWKP